MWPYLSTVSSTTTPPKNEFSIFSLTVPKVSEKMYIEWDRRIWWKVMNNDHNTQKKTKENDFFLRLTIIFIHRSWYHWSDIFYIIDKREWKINLCDVRRGREEHTRPRPNHLTQRTKPTKSSTWATNPHHLQTIWYHILRLYWILEWLVYLSAQCHLESLLNIFIWDEKNSLRLCPNLE